MSSEQPGAGIAGRPSNVAQGMQPQQASPVTVYWRPGCPFCIRLRQELHILGLPSREINIWADRSAAALVRSVADGNETVPTVLVGEQALVNPSAAEVLARVREEVPGYRPDPALARAGRAAKRAGVIAWSLIIVAIALGFAADSAGHPRLSWLADGAAVAIWLLYRAVRHLLRSARQRR